MVFLLHLTDGQLRVKQTRVHSYVVVRGKDNYPTAYDPQDPLHQALDQLDPATCSRLFDGTGDVFLNPRNPRTQPSIDFAKQLFIDN